MKTNRLILIFALLICITSCNTYHKVNTRINRDGSMEREIYARGDSAFMAGDNSSSPFLFYPDDTWKITRYDSVMVRTFLDDDIKFNTRIERRFDSPEAFRKEVRPKEYLSHMVCPIEKLEKHFRWFYTYYTYSATYTNISDSLPVALSAYLTDDELRILLQGDQTAWEGRNGAEIYSVLDDMTVKFENWFQECEFDIVYRVISHELRHNEEIKQGSQLPHVRDSIFNKIKTSKEEKPNITAKLVASILDKYYGTKDFSAYMARHEQKIDELIEQKQRLLTLFETNLCFSLEMPGKVLDANTELKDQQALIWKVDAYRFLAHDYTLQARSRTCNAWAFAVTALILLVAISSFIWRRKLT